MMRGLTCQYKSTGRVDDRNRQECICRWCGRARWSRHGCERVYSECDKTLLDLIGEFDRLMESDDPADVEAANALGEKIMCPKTWARKPCVNNNKRREITMATTTSITTKSSIRSKQTLANDLTAGQSITPVAVDPADLTYTSTSTPAGTKFAGDTVTFAGEGAATHTIDLTDLLDIERLAVTGLGLSVQEIRVQAAADNAGAVTVAAAAADGYELFGSGNEVDIQAGGLLQQRSPDQLAVIGTLSAATTTDVTFSGTGEDEFSYEIIMG